MTLPEDDLGSVNRLIQWLDSICCAITGYASAEATEATCWQLTKLYSLADKYDVAALKNHIVEERFHASRKPRSGPSRVLPPDMIEYVYSNLPKNCAFRELIVAWYVWRIDLTWYEGFGKHLFSNIPAFALNIALGLARRALGQPGPFRGPVSIYY